MDRYYLPTLVLYEQNEDVSEEILLYERSLADKRLPHLHRPEGAIQCN